MDLIPADQGGDDYYLNGGYVKLKDAGAFANNGNPAPQKAPEPEKEEPKQTEEEAENKSPSKGYEQRKKQRRSQ